MNTQKLIDELKKHSNHTISDVMTNKDGEQYRFHHWKLKYPHASNWLVKLFEKASEENTGKTYNSNFSSGDYSFYYDRPQFKGQPNGTMQMRMLEVDVYANGGLIAPNGKPSNLSPEQYKLVRTPEFKAWFGDWENDPANASKVVDENGEPLVVYHSTKIDFTEFNKKRGGNHYGIYFSANEESTKTYGHLTKAYFLKVINPEIPKFWFHSVIDESMMDRMIKNNLDGAFWLRKKYNSNQFELYEIVVFEPEQIKLADGTNTTFDGNNPDIRFDGGGEVRPFYDDGNKYVVFKEYRNYELYKIAVDDVNDAKYITLWKTNKNTGIDKKVGTLRLNDITDDDFLSVSYINIDKGNKGLGLGLEMYKIALKYSSDKIKGIKSYLPLRDNKKQIPKIYRKLNSVKKIDWDIIYKQSNPDIRFAKGGYVTYKDKYNTKYGYKKGTSHTLEQISKDSGVSMKGLQQIYNKGIGAYKTNPQSVRPNVKSKEQWAMARVYSAVMGGKTARIDYKELKMENKGYMKKYDGGGLIGQITEPEVRAMVNYINSKNANQFLVNSYLKVLAKFGVTDLNNVNYSKFSKGKEVNPYDLSGYDYMQSKNEEMGVSFLLTGEYELVSKAIYEKDYPMWLFYNYMGRINISFESCQMWLNEAQKHFKQFMPIDIILLHTPNAKDGRSYAMWYATKNPEEAGSRLGLEKALSWEFDGYYYYQEIGMVGNFDNPNWQGWGSYYKERKTGLLFPEYTQTSFHLNTLMHEFAHCLDFQSQLLLNIAKLKSQKEKLIKGQNVDIRALTDLEKELYGNQFTEKPPTISQPITNHFDFFIDALIKVLRASSSGAIPLTQLFEQQSLDVQTALGGVYGDLLLEQRERKRKDAEMIKRADEMRDNTRFTWQSSWIEIIRDYILENAVQESLKEVASKKNKTKPFTLSEILEMDNLITSYLENEYRGFMVKYPSKAESLLEGMKKMKVETNRIINNHFDNIKNKFVFGFEPKNELDLYLLNNCDVKDFKDYKSWKECSKEKLKSFT